MPVTRIPIALLCLAVLAGGCDRPALERAGLTPAGAASPSQERAASLDLADESVPAVGAVGVVQQRTVVVKDETGQPLAGVRVDWLLAPEDQMLAVLLKDSADGEGGHHQSSLTDAEGRAMVWLRPYRPGRVRASALVQTGMARRPLLRETSVEVVDARVEPPRQMRAEGAAAILVTRVLRASDGKPLAGYPVRWTLADAEAGRFRESGSEQASTLTDARGVARVHVLPGRQPAESAQVKVDVEKPAGQDCQCRQREAVRIGGGQTRLAWAATDLETDASAAKPAPRPELRLALTCPGEVELGDAVELRLSVANAGAGVARDVRLLHALPAGLRHATGKSALEWRHDRIAPGQTLTTTLQASAETPGVAESVARIGATPVQARCATQVRQGRLALGKQGPAARYLGQTARYDIQLRNTGDGVARGVVVGDVYPPGLSFLSASPAASHDAGKRQITWSLDNLPAGEARQLRAEFRTAGIGQSCNQAQAHAERAAPAQARVCTEVKGLAALRLEVVDGPDPVVIGSPTVYRIEVFNQGTASATQVAVRATLPEQMAYLDAGGPTQAVVDGRDIRFGPVSTLGPGETVVYTVRARALTQGDVRFATEISARELDATVRETESTRLYD